MRELLILEVVLKCEMKVKVEFDRVEWPIWSSYQTFVANIEEIKSENWNRRDILKVHQVFDVFRDFEILLLRIFQSFFAKFHKSFIELFLYGSKVFHVPIILNFFFLSYSIFERFLDPTNLSHLSYNIMKNL